MKKQLRSYFVLLLGLWLTAEIIPTVHFEHGLITALKATTALLLVNLFVKPILNLLFLPINLLTLGTLRWLINTAGLYIVLRIIKDFKISAFRFSGLNYNGFAIPALDFSNLWAVILASLLISFSTGIIYWLIKK